MRIFKMYNPQYEIGNYYYMYSMLIKVDSVITWSIFAVVGEMGRLKQNHSVNHVAYLN